MTNQRPTTHRKNYNTQQISLIQGLW